MKKLLYTLLFGLTILSAEAQTTQELKNEIERVQRQLSNMRHTFDRMNKNMDDLMWYNKVGDVAYIDKVELTGPKPRVIKNPTGQGAQNPVRFKTYVFIPKSADASKKYPLMVLPHGGVHSNFNTFYAHIIRELMAQGYVVVAPEYRGSTGYGRRFYELIDYGGLEIEDVKASRDYMIENYDLVDANRIGIFGWSHGGLITLMNLYNHPKAYKVGYAGVPVSDLIARMGYKSDGYEALYAADYHIGKEAYQDVEEYKRRSPAWNTHKLETPLLIHSNTNDEDVNVLEVQHLIKSLKADGKKFESEIYQDIPGGHAFDRLDTKIAKEVRLKIYKFLAGYLNPPNAFKNLGELQRAGYGF